MGRDLFISKQNVIATLDLKPNKLATFMQFLRVKFILEIFEMMTLIALTRKMKINSFSYIVKVQRPHIV